MIINSINGRPIFYGKIKKHDFAIITIYSIEIDDYLGQAVSGRSLGNRALNWIEIHFRHTNLQAEDADKIIFVKLLIFGYINQLKY